MKKKYKVGDRIFYECYDGSIETDIVLDIENEYYISNFGKKTDYQWLVTEKSDHCTMGIEDYNCLSPNDPKCKQLAKFYSVFDNQKNEIIDSIVKTISSWNPAIQKEIIKLIKIKLKIE